MSTRLRAPKLASAASALTVLSLCSVEAAAQLKTATFGTTTTVGTTTGTFTGTTTGTIAPPEQVIDLGVYDSSVAAHTDYVLAPPDGGGSGTACPSDPAAYSWSRTWTKSGEFGNSTFGAGYEGKLRVTSTAAAGSDPDKMSIYGELRGLGTIFGNSVTMLKGSGHASLAGNVGSAGASLQVVGITVWSESGQKTLTATRTFTKTFFSHSQWITLGIVPVHFKATAAGQLGYHYNVNTVGNTIDLTFNPWGKAYATASASVDLILASAGVEGTLTLVEASAPAHGLVSIYPTGIHYNVDADVEVEALSGVINAYAKVPGKKWTMQIASWPPIFDATFPIIHADNCDTEILHASCGDNQCSGNETYYNCPDDCEAPPPDEDDYDIPPICLSQPWKCTEP